MKKKYAKRRKQDEFEGRMEAQKIKVNFNIVNK